MRGFLAGAGPRRRPSPQPLTARPKSWADLRREAHQTRWLWWLPVEAGYAASLIEVQREWSLDDVLMVADRVAERNDQQERMRREADRRRPR